MSSQTVSVRPKSVGCVACGAVDQFKAEKKALEQHQKAEKKACSILS